MFLASLANWYVTCPYPCPSYRIGKLTLLTPEQLSGLGLGGLLDNLLGGLGLKNILGGLGLGGIVGNITGKKKK